MSASQKRVQRLYSRNDRTGAQSWIKGALDIITHEGIHKLRIERLAREIKVSKGSFYWFFDDHADLLKCCLEYWKMSLNTSVFDKIRQLEGSVQERLFSLVDTIFESKLGRFDAAIRAWSLNDPVALSVVQEVDRDRLEFLYEMFNRNGLPEETVRQHVHLFYRALIAESYLNEYPSDISGAVYLKGLVQSILESSTDTPNLMSKIEG